MNSQEWQIVELNTTVKCTLKPSPIHGIGVFTLRDIKKGERMYCFTQSTERRWYTIPYGSFNKIDQDVRELIVSRWASVINGSRFCSPNDDAWLILFMNHSDTPNYEVKTDIALRDIQKGEEVFEDYCLMQNADKVYPELCEKTSDNAVTAKNPFMCLLDKLPIGLREKLTGKL